MASAVTEGGIPFGTQIRRIAEVPRGSTSCVWHARAALSVVTRVWWVSAAFSRASTSGVCVSVTTAAIAIASRPAASAILMLTIAAAAQGC